MKDYIVALRESMVNGFEKLTITDHVSGGEVHYPWEVKERSTYNRYQLPGQLDNTHAKYRTLEAFLEAPDSYVANMIISCNTASNNQYNMSYPYHITLSFGLTDNNIDVYGYDGSNYYLHTVFTFDLGFVKEGFVFDEQCLVKELIPEMLTKASDHYYDGEGDWKTDVKGLCDVVGKIFGVEKVNLRTIQHGVYNSGSCEVEELNQYKLTKDAFVGYEWAIPKEAMDFQSKVYNELLMFASGLNILKSVGEPHINPTYGLVDFRDVNGRQAFLVTNTRYLLTTMDNMRHSFNVNLISHENGNGLDISMSGNDEKGRYYSVRRTITPEGFEQLKNTLKELSTLSPSEAVLGLRDVLKQLPEGKDNGQ